MVDRVPLSPPLRSLSGHRVYATPRHKRLEQSGRSAAAREVCIQHATPRGGICSPAALADTHWALKFPAIMSCLSSAKGSNQLLPPCTRAVCATGRGGTIRSRYRASAWPTDHTTSLRIRPVAYRRSGAGQRRAARSCGRRGCWLSGPISLAMEQGAESASRLRQRSFAPLARSSRSGLRCPRRAPQATLPRQTRPRGRAGKAVLRS